MGIENFDLKKFREEFLQSDGWQVSDCYKSYDDKFLRKDAQDAYEGAKWAWVEQQKEINELNLKMKRLRLIMTDYHTGSFDESAEIAGLISKVLLNESQP